MKRLHHVLVFDEFSQKGNKISYLLENSKGQVQLTDKQLKEIEDELGVSNFDEFLEKFAPVVYPVMTEEGASWTLEDNGNTPIKIDKNFKAFKLMLDIMEKRKSSGQSNLEFNWEDSFQSILPASMVEDAKALRGQLEYNKKQLDKLDKADPKYKEIANKIVKTRKEIVKIYQDNPLNLLPLAIEDSKKKLQNLGYTPNSTKEVKESPKLGYLEFSPNGEIEFKEIKNKKEAVTDLVLTEAKENSNSLTIQNWLENDYNKVTKEDKKNNYVKNLVLSTFTNKYEIIESTNVEELKARYTQQLDIYKAQLENSFESLSEIFTKLLGIKAFFDQGNEKMDVKLIILNENVNELVKRKKLLNTYLSSLNLKEFSKDLNLGANIYTAIIPNVIIGKDEVEFEVDDLDDISFEEEEKQIDGKTSNLGSAKEILEELTKENILTFINFKADKDSNFESMQKYGIKKFEEDLKTASFNKKTSYIVPCYPNFTVVADTDFKVDLRIDNKDSYTYLKGVYIDASYVTAGLVAAYLNPQGLLHTKRFDIKKSELNMENPGVRINLEEPKLGRKIVTALAKESNLGIIGKIKSEIRELNQGFIFICDEKVNYMYPMICRNTKKEEIFKVLLLEYIKKVVNEKTKGSLAAIKELNKNIFRNWEKEVDKLNSIIKEGEKVTVDTEEKEPKIVVSLVKDGAVIEDLDIQLDSLDD